MQFHLLRPKIHPALVTDANVEYEGSLTIDPDLIDMSIKSGSMVRLPSYSTFASVTSAG